MNNTSFGGVEEMFVLFETDGRRLNACTIKKMVLFAYVLFFEALLLPTLTVH